MKLPVTIEDYIEILKSDQPFTQANYGDGEWSCMLSKPGQNSQGGIYYPELGKALKKTIVTPRFTAFGYNSGRVLHEEVERILGWLGYPVPKYNTNPIEVLRPAMEGCHVIPWVYKEILAAANCQGRLGPFIKQLNQMNVLLVGPPHLDGLGVLKGCTHRTVPGRNMWNDIDSIFHNLIYYVAARNPDVVLMSCGMASNVLSWRLIGEGYMGKILDTGAIWDPYVGVLSRKGYKKPEFQEMLVKNIEESV